MSSVNQNVKRSVLPFQLSSLKGRSELLAVGPPRIGVEWRRSWRSAAWALGAGLLPPAPRQQQNAIEAPAMRPPTASSITCAVRSRSSSPNRLSLSSSAPSQSSTSATCMQKHSHWLGSSSSGDRKPSEVRSASSCSRAKAFARLEFCTTASSSSLMS
eukprot:scaffold109_cov252-Pinguiococcus_pyrenoidosus.AAC.11